MSDFTELFDLAGSLERAAAAGKDSAIVAPLAQLEDAATKVGKSFSGSWLGYHANVYYNGLQTPPSGAHFSQEWGLKEIFGDLGSKGAWREIDPDAAKAHIRQLAGGPSLAQARSAADAADKAFDVSKTSAISVFLNMEAVRADPFIAKLRTALEDLAPLSASDVVAAWKPSGQIMTRDMVALGQSFRIPPHIEVLSEIASLRHSFQCCSSAADLCRKVASHAERSAKMRSAEKRIGTNVFIGHGRSRAWKDLKDFIQDRLGLPYDEFNRVPVAGLTNISRLSEMLDSAAVALVVLTAEDEMADGELQARMNVIHEAGLFQGRLGFTKAILLLEDGCAEFSNVQGLGQIRFPKDQISSCFEEVRRVLEREKVVEE